MDATTVGPYRLLQHLGQGGTSSVFAAVREDSGEFVALKAPKTPVPAVAMRRLQRETETLSLLRHPNIAGLVDADLGGESPYLAIELVIGASVHDLTKALLERNRRLPIEAALYLGRGAIEGLVHAHEARGPNGAPLGLIHRDISPKNVMVSVFGELKLIDFGLVRAEEDPGVTRPGVIVGTLPYLSPEQVRREPLDHRTDQYSLAVILVELLTGEFLVPLGDRQESYRAILERTPPRPSAHNPRVPRALDEVLLTALAKRREHRFPTTRAFLEAFDAAIRTVPVARPARLGEAVRSLCPETEALLSRLEALRARTRIVEVPPTASDATDLEATVLERASPDPEKETVVKASAIIDSAWLAEARRTVAEPHRAKALEETEPERPAYVPRPPRPSRPPAPARRHPIASRWRTGRDGRPDPSLRTAALVLLVALLLLWPLVRLAGEDPKPPRTVPTVRLELTADS